MNVLTDLAKAQVVDPVTSAIHNFTPDNLSMLVGLGEHIKDLKEKHRAISGNHLMKTGNVYNSMQHVAGTIAHLQGLGEELDNLHHKHEALMKSIGGNLNLQGGNYLIDQGGNEELEGGNIFQTLLDPAKFLVDEVQKL